MPLVFRFAFWTPRLPRAAPPAGSDPGTPADATTPFSPSLGTKIEAARERIRRAGMRGDVLAVEYETRCYAALLRHQAVTRANGRRSEVWLVVRRQLGSRLRSLGYGWSRQG